jgi:hypothetical protein
MENLQVKGHLSPTQIKRPIPDLIVQPVSHTGAAKPPGLETPRQTQHHLKVPDEDRSGGYQNVHLNPKVAGKKLQNPIIQVKQ